MWRAVGKGMGFMLKSGIGETLRFTPIGFPIWRREPGHEIFFDDMFNAIWLQGLAEVERQIILNRTDGGEPKRKSMASILGMEDHK